MGYIGTNLNSGGRLGQSKLATKLLLSENKKEAENISNKLFILNEKRKIIEDKTLIQINKNLIIKRNFIFYYQKNLNEGILGILAARLSDKHNLPVFLITNSGNIYKGSARSIEGVDIGKILLNSVQNKILIKGGGHAMAGGFSLLKSNIAKLEKYLDISVKNKIKNNNIYIPKTH